MNNLIGDPYFRVAVIEKTPNPQQVIWCALHQDYSEEYIFEEERPPEDTSGEIAVKRLLEGRKGHFGCLEHPSISFAVGYFPHSVMQQARTHRIAVSFDVQSMRYSGKRVLDVVSGKRNIESVFYLRPVGNYTDRQGKKYHYSEEQRQRDLLRCMESAYAYATMINEGCSEEHARGVLAFDFRQHFMVSFSLRSLMHFLDLRAKRDAQPEIATLCEFMLPHFQSWTPRIYAWYAKDRLHRAILSP